MASGVPPNRITNEQLDTIQGDLWSKGFPKDYETYYFFSIVQDKRKEFAQCLKKLFENQDAPLISSLRMVSENRVTIRANKREFRAAKNAGTAGENEPAPRVIMSNALIAFTYKGLETGGIAEKDTLGLRNIRRTDPVFFEGMSKDGDAAGKRLILNDPKLEKWDPLFQSPDNIHGLLKIAGSDKEVVDSHLKEIQTVLQHGVAMKDVSGNSPPTLTNSRIDGWTRLNHRGKEHFGFEDGISQPRMTGIDEEEPPTNDNGRTNMNTMPHILIVSKHTHKEREDKIRPEWMHDGSFLVVRKLQQDVKAFGQLTDNWQKYNCENKAQMEAKLMGRYKSGTPIALPEHHQNDTFDPSAANKVNDFGFNNEPKQACPFSAHIRKTNLRVPFDGNVGDQRAPRTRIIRSGISYGSNYEGNENDVNRGLIFACYQGLIEDGFLNMQANWSNNEEFREDKPGHDPIIGQVQQTSPGNNGELKTTITDKTHKDKQTVKFTQLVTLKGGEYFFVPSIPALKGILAEV